MKRITDKSFVYTPSFDTDLKKKFRIIIERERKLAREQAALRKAADEAQARADEEAKRVVAPIRKVSK